MNWGFLWLPTKEFGHFKFQIEYFKITCCFVHLGQLVAISSGTELPHNILGLLIRTVEVNVQGWLQELTEGEIEVV